MDSGSWVKINVGGQVFETSLETVTKYPSSKLAAMFQQEREIFTLDLDPQYFRVILSWLRYEVLSVPASLDWILLVASAQQLGLDSLALQLRRKVREVRREERGVREPAMTDWLKLNVGGRMFETSRSTLTSDCNSSLARMFEPDSGLLHFPPVSIARDQGVYKIDSSPHTFSVILNWLRYRSLVLAGVEARDVLPAADYFCLPELRLLLERRIRLENKKKNRLVVSLERASEKVEEVLQSMDCALTGINQKLGEIKEEVSSVASGVEDIWRVKCELSSLNKIISEGGSQAN